MSNRNYSWKQKVGNLPQIQIIRIVLCMQLMIQTVDPAAASVNDYIFNFSSGSYIPITGTTLFFGTWDDSNSALLPIPFSFTFNGSIFNSLSVSSNGFITLGSLTSTVYCGLQASGPNSIAAFGTDLMGNPGSTVQYATTGSSPNQKYIIQWTDCAHYLSTVDHYSFQIILHETSNIIQVIYGPFIAQTTMGANNCVDAATESGNVGLKGFSDLDINIRSITNGTNDWNSSTAGNSVNAVCELSPLNFPASGLTYSWTPSTTLAMILTSCTAAIVNDGYHDGQSSLNNPIVRLQVVTTGNLAPITIDSIGFSTAGSTNAGADISEANIYMTGLSDVFSASTIFGYTVSDPNGMHIINGQATLQEGNNYFWLAYDITSGAIGNDSIAGCVLQIKGSSIGWHTPSSICPPGHHIIGATTLNLTVFFDEFYRGGRTMNAVADPINHPMLCDTITVELHHSTYPFDLAFKATGTINTNGIGQFYFPTIVLTHIYYIAVRHRNSIETWSKDPVMFNSPVINFDFTSQ